MKNQKTGESILKKGIRPFVTKRKLESNDWKRNLCEMKRHEVLVSICLLTQTTWDAEDLEIRILKRPGKGQIFVQFPIMIPIHHSGGVRKLQKTGEHGQLTIQDDGSVQILMGSDKRHRICLDFNMFLDYLQTINVKPTNQ